MHTVDRVFRALNGAFGLTTADICRITGLNRYNVAHAIGMLKRAHVEITTTHGFHRITS